VTSNVELGLEWKGILPVQRAAQAINLINLVGLQAFENHYPHELSGGMKQRVGLARGPATEPEVLTESHLVKDLDCVCHFCRVNKFYNLRTVGKCSPDLDIWSDWALTNRHVSLPYTFPPYPGAREFLPRYPSPS